MTASQAIDEMANALGGRGVLRHEPGQILVTTTPMANAERYVVAAEFKAETGQKVWVYAANQGLFDALVGPPRLPRLVHEAGWKVGERRRGMFDGGLLRTFTTVRYSDGWDTPCGWDVRIEESGGQVPVGSHAWIGGMVPDVFELLEGA